MEQALRTEFDVREIIDRVPFSGRTDPAISHDLLEIHGLEPSPANITRLKTAYLSYLPGALEQRQLYAGQHRGRSCVGRPGQSDWRRPDLHDLGHRQ